MRRLSHPPLTDISLDPCSLTVTLVVGTIKLLTLTLVSSHNDPATVYLVEFTVLWESSICWKSKRTQERVFSKSKNCQKLFLFDWAILLKHCGLMNIFFCPIRFHLAFNFWAKSSDEIVSFPDLLPTMILVRGYVLLTFHFFSCTKFREHILNFMCSCRVFVFTSISGNSNFVLICIASSLNWCYYFI